MRARVFVCSHSLRGAMAEDACSFTLGRCEHIHQACRAWRHPPPLLHGCIKRTGLCPKWSLAHHIGHYVRVTPFCSGVRILNVSHNASLKVAYNRWRYIPSCIVRREKPNCLIFFFNEARLLVQFVLGTKMHIMCNAGSNRLSFLWLLSSAYRERRVRG